MREVKDLHLPFIAYLKKQGIPYVYHRPDKASGIAKGHPDFTLLWDGRTCLIEFKTLKEGKLSQDQIDRIAALETTGTPVRVCTSLEEAIGHSETLTRQKHTVAIRERKQTPSPKLWLNTSSLGDVVVQKGTDGDIKFVRLATTEDRKNLVHLSKWL